jgi:hypothetical protein
MCIVSACIFVFATIIHMMHSGLPRFVRISMRILGGEC